jgi:hypothetical protein
LEGAGHDRLLADVTARLSVALSLSASDERRLHLADRAVELARSCGEPATLGRALAAHCDAIASPDHVLDRLAESSEIVTIAERTGDAPLELLGRRLRYVACLELGDLVSVDREVAAFERRADALGNPLYSWYGPLWRAQMALLHGDFDGCDAGIAQIDAMGHAAGSLNAPMLAVVLRLGRHGAAGDVEAVAAMVDGFIGGDTTLARYLSSVGAFARAYALAGRRGEATLLLDRAAAEGLHHLAFDAEWLACMAMIVDAAVMLDHPIVTAALEALEPYADLMAFEGIGAGLYGATARFVARGCSMVGRHDDAVAYARRALDLDRRIGGSVVGESHRTLAECLERRGSTGDSADAADHHGQADLVFGDLGLTHLVRSSGSASAPSRGPAPAEPPGEPLGEPLEPPGEELRRDGDVWHVTFAGTTTIVKHTKGMADLAVLLAAPGRAIHVTELEGVHPDALGSRGADALDRRAIRAYRDRLAELTEEIDDADAAHDLARAERARVEHDALVDQLAGSMGLGGRPRAAGADPVERLRKAVSARIRDTIGRLGERHPPLGRHLGNAVRTGTYCSYQPEQPVVWRCQTGSGASRP